MSDTVNKVFTNNSSERFPVPHALTLKTRENRLQSLNPVVNLALSTLAFMLCQLFHINHDQKCAHKTQVKLQYRAHGDNAEQTTATTAPERFFWTDARSYGLLLFMLRSRGVPNRNGCGVAKYDNILPDKLLHRLVWWATIISQLHSLPKNIFGNRSLSLWLGANE